MTEEKGNYAVSVIDSVDVQSVQATMGKIAKFQAVVQNTLKDGHDYGKIPGTDKPTLLKPGAEKIFMLMGLTSEYEVTEKVEDYEKGFFAYTVRCSLSKNGYPITEGLGHANTKEARYARRWVTEKKLPDGVDKKNLQKREKPSKYGKGTYAEYLLENDDPFTLVNTVLKMAKKRAQVDAALTVGSLSQIFTQDLEDVDLQDEPPSSQTSKPETGGKGDQDGGISKAQAKRMFALAGGSSDIVRLVLKEYGYDKSEQVQKTEYEEVCMKIEAIAAEKKQAEEEAPAEETEEQVVE